MELSQARAQLRELQSVLERIHQKDPEQEVRGIAIPVLDSIIEAVRRHLPDNEVTQAISGVFSVETISDGEPVRAVDALMVVTALKTALGDSVPMPVAIPRDPRWPSLMTMDF